MAVANNSSSLANQLTNSNLAIDIRICSKIQNARISNISSILGVSNLYEALKSLRITTCNEINILSEIDGNRGVSTVATFRIKLTVKFCFQTSHFSSIVLHLF